MTSYDRPAPAAPREPWQDPALRFFAYLLDTAKLGAAAPGPMQEVYAATAGHCGWAIELLTKNVHALARSPSPPPPSPRDPRDEARKAAFDEVLSALGRVVFTEISGLSGLRLKGPDRDDWIVRATARKTLSAVGDVVRALAGAGEGRETR